MNDEILKRLGYREYPNNTCNTCCHLNVDDAKANCTILASVIGNIELPNRNGQCKHHETHAERGEID